MLKKTLMDKVFEKIILGVFIVLFLFLLSISVTLAQISIDNIDMPTSLEENNNLTVSFSAVDMVNTTYFKIYYDNLLVAQDSSYTMFMNYSDAGTHTFTFFASDNDTNVSVDQSIEVLDVPMLLSLVNPTSRIYSERNIPISVIVSTYADSCSYNLFIVNNSVRSYVLNDVLTGNNTEFYTNLVLTQDGNYSLFVNCSNIYDTVNASVSFIVDTVSPVITAKSHIFNEYNNITFNIVTSIASICKYDLQDKSYVLMSSVFDHTGNTVHSTTINNLANGAYTYYIKCNSNNTLTSNTETISFTILTKPLASITLSKSSPLKAGIYEVKLKTSKAVINAPTLSYNFNTDATLRYVTLTGSGTDWKGYLIIEDNTPDRIGTFHYSATDYDGNTGNIISSGELFLTDTTKPVAPSSISATAQLDGNIKLKWYFDNENIKKYLIYRSTEGDPTYVDYYDNSSSMQYIDRDLIEGITYYYRVAAMDEAYNTGALSEMVQAVSNDVVSSNSDSNSNVVSDNTAQQISDPALILKINQLVTDFNKQLLDIAAAKSELNKINDPTKLKIIAILGLSEKVNSAKTTIENLITEVNNLKNENVPSSELDVKLNKFRMDALKAKSLVVEDIIVSEQSSYNQVTQESDVSSAITELVKINLSKSVLNNYSDANNKLQDGIVVNTDIFIFKIRYLGKDDYDKYTLVKKTVSSASELNNVSIVEIIPKSFERKASDILFDIDNQKTPIIVNDDPVLKWDNAIFNKQTIYYMINNNAEMYAAKATKTVVLYTPNFKVTQTIPDEVASDNTNMLTGFISTNVENINLSSLSTIQWAIILGVGLILALSTYYVALDGVEKKRNNARLKDHKIISKKSGLSSGLSISSSNGSLSSSNILSNTSVLSKRKSLTSKIFSKLSLKKLSSVNTKMVSDVSLAPVVTSINVSNNAVTTNNLKDKINVNVPRTRIDLKNFNIHSKLDQANTRINSFDYENARTIYNLCLASYNFDPYTRLEKEELLMMLDHLHSKLIVYRAIFLSRQHLISRDYVSLKNDINIITKVSKKLYSALQYMDDDYKDSELKFINYINNSRKHLESKLS